MYTIKKVPSPRGFTILNREIKVNSVIGPGEIYMDDGELRARITEKVPSDKVIKFEVIYKRNYSDGSQNEFSAIEFVTNEKDSFSLSAAPFSRYVESVDISIQRIEDLEGSI